ncbi:MAG: ribosome-associated translation inhibitor RaiA [Armatimonadia bacterium]|nr:ribosome-associated translation inhibitor RaiA [Armatimonadia bacterium]
MRTFVKGTNIKVTEAMKSYAEERLQRLTRYENFLNDVTLVYSVQRAWHIAEVTTRFGDTILRAEERSNDMYVSVDKAVEKLEQQLERLKGRMDRRRRAARDRGEVDDRAEEIVAAFSDGKPEDQDVIDVEPLGDGQVVKVKTYAVKPMSTEEALLQMELVDHDFFVFVRDDTQEVDVLYKRHDGDFGLLVPDTQ